ncbi:hypothetical protein CEUSTIGMA_g10519.t1 [Chlamydomonas eustigma]|uniref:Uncharacterized protein n=1 Tax=Chlamydomonas eustigma TaxID=1157962 RepID=A0A250XJ82_9CHLO|nr:hypothetical protein CEUSTIGMA_g10519.t1 [Chlamydomonas eustigma]|eukprot:GAX83093.1 hypothetical protein CEUSTIGMA_g10519.t1 [Chlamydomonas eustigma]
MSSLSSRSRLRSALDDFGQQVKDFSKQVGDGIAQVQRSADMPYSSNGRDYKLALANLEEELNEISQEVQHLQQFSFDSLSFEELLGHCLAAYSSNRGMALKLASSLGIHLYEPEDPACLNHPAVRAVSFTHHDDAIKNEDEESNDVDLRNHSGLDAETFGRTQSHSKLRNRQQTPGFQRNGGKALQDEKESEDDVQGPSPDQAALPLTQLRPPATVSSHTLVATALSQGMLISASKPRPSLDSGASSTPDMFMLSPSLMALQNKYGSNDSQPYPISTAQPSPEDDDMDLDESSEAKPALASGNIPRGPPSLTLPQQHGAVLNSKSFQTEVNSISHAEQGHHMSVSQASQGAGKETVTSTAGIATIQQPDIAVSRVSSSVGEYEGLVTHPKQEQLSSTLKQLEVLWVTSGQAALTPRRAGKDRNLGCSLDNSLDLLASVSLEAETSHNGGKHEETSSSLLLMPTNDAHSFVFDTVSAASDVTPDQVGASVPPARPRLTSQLGGTATQNLSPGTSQLLSKVYGTACPPDRLDSAKHRSTEASEPRGRGCAAPVSSPRQLRSGTPSGQKVATGVPGVGTCTMYPVDAPDKLSVQPAQYALLPAFCRAQLTLEQLNGGLWTLREAARSKSEAGQLLDFSLDDLEREGVSAGKSKVLVNSLVKLGFAEICSTASGVLSYKLTRTVV